MISKFEKMFLVETLHQLADEIDAIEYSKADRLKWVIVNLKEITDKLECWNEGKEYINPLN